MVDDIANFNLKEKEVIVNVHFGYIIINDEVLPLEEFAFGIAGESIGPIQMGLNKPAYFTDIEASVRDIVNLTAVAAVDAIVYETKETKVF